MAGRKLGPRQDMAEAEFHVASQTALSSAVLNVQLSPSGLGTYSNRISAMADEFAHFRVKSLRFRLHPIASTAAVAIGFCGGIQDTPPGSATQVLELLPSTVLTATTVKPTEWVRVSSTDLKGPFPWYKALNGTGDTTEEAPGALIMSGSQMSDPVFFELYITLQFKTAVSPSNTPVEYALRQRLREARRARVQLQAQSALARVLSGPAPSPAATVVVPRP